MDHDFSVKGLTLDDIARPRVGVAAVVWRTAEREELLLGKGHNDATTDEIFAVTGGHWESGETLYDAAIRETREEAGVELTDLKLISVFDFFNEEKGRSYVTIGFSAIWSHGEPVVLEVEKKVNWSWYTPAQALELPLFLPDRVLIERAMADGPIYEVASKRV